MGSGQLLTYLHLPMTFAVVVMAAAVEVSLSGFTASQPDGGGVGLLEAARHIIGGGTGRWEAGPDLPGARLLFGGLALWLACFLALRVVVVGLRRLGAAGWATAGVVAALALGAVLLGPVRATELLIFAGGPVAAACPGRPRLPAQGTASAPHSLPEACSSRNSILRSALRQTTKYEVKTRERLTINGIQ